MKVLIKGYIPKSTDRVVIYKKEYISNKKALTIRNGWVNLDHKSLNINFWMYFKPFTLFKKKKIIKYINELREVYPLDKCEK